MKQLHLPEAGGGDVNWKKAARKKLQVQVFELVLVGKLEISVAVGLPRGPVF
jgi:hypothetical protein